MALDLKELNNSLKEAQTKDKEIRRVEEEVLKKTKDFAEALQQYVGKVIISTTTGEFIPKEVKVTSTGIRQMSRETQIRLLATDCQDGEDHDIFLTLSMIKRIKKLKG